MTIRLTSLCLLLLPLISSGCVRYNKTADVRSRLAGGLRQFDRALNQAESNQYVMPEVRSGLLRDAVAITIRTLLTGADRPRCGSNYYPNSAHRG